MSRSPKSPLLIDATILGHEVGFAGAAIDQSLFPLADFLADPLAEFGATGEPLPASAAAGPTGSEWGLTGLDTPFSSDDSFAFAASQAEAPHPMFDGFAGAELSGPVDAGGVVSYSIAASAFFDAAGFDNPFPVAWEGGDVGGWAENAILSAAEVGAGGAPSGPVGGGAAITMLGGDFAAKGGSPGKPDSGGGDGGGDTGTTNPGVLSEYFAGSGDGDAGYDIWLDFKGTQWTAELQQAFIDAADYFTMVITADIGGGGLYRGKVVDDLYVTAELSNIDGEGGVLGQAGATAVWTANDLTAAGKMQFDVADATTFYGMGLWDDIITHELTHVLGFGSLWNYGDHSLAANGQYTGQYALDAYRDAMNDPTLGFIPVELDGGSGTAGAHWDEEALGNELMTGWINTDGDPTTNTDNYLSEFSVMSLADLGYTVAYQDYPYDDLPIA